MPLSIVVPVYNRATLIGRCVASVLTQAFGDYELILVDDASTDDSLARMREFSDPRIRIVQHERNRGTGAGRNTGIDAARGEWIVFLDSDDELMKGAFGRLQLSGFGCRFRAEPEPGTLQLRPSQSRSPGYVTG